MKHAETIGWGLIFALAGILTLLAAPLLIERADDARPWVIGGLVAGIIGTPFLAYAFLATAEEKPTE